MPPLSSSSSSSKIVAEYAKSSRSSCKKCSKTIAAKTLRLGLVTRDTRGFDMTKWHHLGCFPVTLGAMDPVEKISGFSSLENDDQAALKELVQQCGNPSEVEARENDGDTEERKGTNKRKDSRVEKKDDENEQAESDERSTKMKKSSSPQIKAPLDLMISLSDIKDKYRDAKLLPKWKALETVIFLERDEGLKDSEKIAAFDFDGCLANTNVKITGENAWSLMYASIPEKLQSVYGEGYKLVIFTNESNIDRWKNKRQVAVDSKVGRLNNFINLVKVPIQVFIACGVTISNGKEDPFRKPKTGMWQIMKDLFNSGIAIDMDQSFYVGDAAGRPDDHSDADIKFAQALGLKFYVPEEYF